MLTDRQELYAKYMLNQIGIDDENFIDIYLQKMEQMYGKMISIGTDPFGKELWRYTNAQCISELIEEIKIKKNLFQLKTIQKSFNHLNASMISDYAFCPASFSISESFEIEKPNSIELTEIGSNFHEDIILLKNIDRYNGKYQIGYVDETTGQEEEIKKIFESNEQFKNILKSNLIFCGHKEKKLFINPDLGFVGIPDYIFQDTNEHLFVIEEKFHYRKDQWRDTYFEKRYNYFDYDRVNEAKKWDNTKITFYESHLIQTYAYLRNIIDFQLEYGFLIYWFYDFTQNGFPYIHRAEIKLVEKDSEIENYYQKIINGIKELTNNPSQQFDIKKLNPCKCASCIVSKYCAHKTGKLEFLHFPYRKEDLRLKFVPFPAKLKKTSDYDSENLPF